MDQISQPLKKDDGRFPSINYMNGIIHRNEKPRNSIQRLKNIREIESVKDKTMYSHAYGGAISSIKPNDSFIQSTNPALHQSVDTFRSPKDFPKIEVSSEKTRNKNR